MNREFFSLRDSPRRYLGASPRTPTSRIDPLNQPNSLDDSAIAAWGGSGNPPYPTHQNGVVCVMELTHLTPDWCEWVRGGWSA